MAEAKTPAGERLLALMRQVDQNQQRLEAAVRTLEAIEKRLEILEARIARPAAKRR